MPDPRTELGHAGEDLAARYLTRRGYAILRRNYRVRSGEIDLIARHRGELVFIEVKTRRGTNQGHPAEAVTPKKQRQIVKAAMCYLQEKNAFDHPVRFDVVAILLRPDGPPVIDVIENAFELSA